MFKPFLRSLTLIVALLLLAACGTQQVDTVNVQLSWLDNIEFSAFYLAEAKGYYRERNLSVNLIDVFDEEGNYRSAVEQVTSGAADFAITNSGDVLIARAAGQPVVAIMAIYQRHPSFSPHWLKMILCAHKILSAKPFMSHRPVSPCITHCLVHKILTSPM